MLRPVPVGVGVAAPAVVAALRLRQHHRHCRFRNSCGPRLPSADLRAVPSNLSPSLAEAPSAKPAVFLNGCVRSWRDVGQPECASGDTASPTTVALVGDSHATMWQPALEPVAQQRHWRLQTMSKVLCPLQDLPINSPYLGRKYTECEQWRGDIMSRLEKDRPRLIMLDMGRGTAQISVSLRTTRLG